MKKLAFVLVVLLPACGGRSTGEWIEQLAAKESSQRLRAVKALAQRRGEAEAVVPALARALADEDAFVRRDAAAALGGFGPAARPALPALSALVRDRKPAVRRAALAALKKIDKGER
jgi:HEAT repeat protein